MYIISLKGEHVFQGHSIEGVFNHSDSLSSIRDKIEGKYGVKFSQNPYRKVGHHESYSNITDDRDISLVIDKVSVLD